MTGVIKTLRADKGFGFIKGSDGSQYFFIRAPSTARASRCCAKVTTWSSSLARKAPRGRERESVRRTST